MFVFSQALNFIDLGLIKNLLHLFIIKMQICSIDLTTVETTLAILERTTFSSKQNFFIDD